MTLLLDNDDVRRVLRMDAHAVYESACAAGVGRELPTEWFTQKEKP